MENWKILSLTFGGDAQNFESRVQVLLQEHNIQSLNEQDASTLDGKDLQAGEKRWVCYFDSQIDEVELTKNLSEIAVVTETEIQTKWDTLTDDSWKTNWKEWFVPSQVSPRIAIRAPWVEFEAAKGSKTIVIEPGMAFGTGLHETTRLCICQMDSLTEKNKFSTMLDVGCGSGVLSIAAALLNIPQVMGIDNDPVAVKVSLENAQSNGVTATFSDVDISVVERTFDLVVANIISGVLIEMKEHLRDRTQINGNLVLSGILNTESDDVLEAFLSLSDLSLVDHNSMGEWTQLTFKRTESN